MVRFGMSSGGVPSAGSHEKVQAGTTFEQRHSGFESSRAEGSSAVPTAAWWSFSLFPWEAVFHHCLIKKN